MGVVRNHGVTPDSSKSALPFPKKRSSSSLDIRGWFSGDGYESPPSNIGAQNTNTNTDSISAGGSIIPLEATFGKRMRRIIYKLEGKLFPVTKRIVPNFIIAHYLYIVLLIILGSVVVYGQKNMSFVDCLFTIASASTQGGLATQQVNDMELYQQITIYFCCFFTSTIFVHGSLTLVRLYWYEKIFDNIKETSMMQYKKRRSKTIANMRSEAHARSQTFANKQYRDSHNASEGLTTRIKRHHDSTNTSAKLSNEKGNVVNLCGDNTVSISPQFPNIKFGDLPKPVKNDLQQSNYESMTSSVQQDLRRSKGNTTHKRKPMHYKMHKKLIKNKKRNQEKMALPHLNTSTNDFEMVELKQFLNESTMNQGTANFERSFSSPIQIRSGVPNDYFLYSTGSLKPFLRLKKIPKSNTLDYQLPSTTETKKDHFSENYGFKFLKRDLSKVFCKTETGANLEGLSDEEFIINYTFDVPSNYLSWTPTIGRNSNFIALTRKQKIELGGVEYQATMLLSKIIFVYYFGLNVLGSIMMVAYVTSKKEYANVIKADGVAPAWWGLFTSMSSLCNLGLTLNASNLMIVAQNAYVQIISAILILCGNTAFPICLRIIIWTMKKFTRPLTLFHDSLCFLLDHPRRCFTLLFPASATWWLAVVLITLNLADWMVFIVLDFDRSTLNYLPRGYQILCGLFQSISTRTAGFNVVNLATLNPAIQLGYMVMMYISVLPLAISIRETNVYEEQSLGIYHDQKVHPSEANTTWKYVAEHLRKQLSFDLWFLFIAIFIICICEAGKIQSDPNFGIFQIMFEVVSAYGTVGLSLGYPNTNTSLSGKFSRISKLVIVATLIRGRHRGLPDKIDRAILLSDDKINALDDLESYRYTAGNDTTHLSHTANLRSDVISERELTPEKADFSHKQLTGQITHLLSKTVDYVLTISNIKYFTTHQP